MSIQTHDTKCDVEKHYEIGDLCGVGAYMEKSSKQSARKPAKNAP